MARRFNEYFKARFEGCRVLAHAYDLHRNREVTIYFIPNEYDVVGVSDGTDCWAAPTVVDPFSVSIKRMIEDLRNGKEPQIVPTLRRRPIANVEAQAPVTEEPRPDQAPRVERRKLGTIAHSWPEDQPQIIQRRPVRA